MQGRQDIHATGEEKGHIEGILDQFERIGSASRLMNQEIGRQIERPETHEEKESDVFEGFIHRWPRVKRRGSRVSGLSTLDSRLLQDILEELRTTYHRTKWL